MGWTGCFFRGVVCKDWPAPRRRSTHGRRHRYRYSGPDLDIGKDVFHIVCFGPDGKIAFRRKIKRLALAETFRKLPPCIVGMEACLSAHSSAAP